MTTTLPVSSATVALGGELDLTTCLAAREALAAAISAGATTLTVDMSAVEFIDASGIGVLIAVANQARSAGGGLSLQAPSWQVQRIVAILHLSGVLPTVADLLEPPDGIGPLGLRLTMATLSH